MEPGFISRNAGQLAEDTLGDTPITVVTGARQVGKSTLVRHLIRGRRARLLNLDERAVRSAALSDPDAFVNQYPDGLLAIDEIQRAPELMTALKAAVDRDRRPGRFLITGSADLLTLSGSQESLAGRAETVPLEGFSQDELAGYAADFVEFAWGLRDGGAPLPEATLNRRDYLELIATPRFPEALRRRAQRRDRWLAGYVERLLAKDSTDITGIQFPDRLATLLRVIAARSSGEFVAARIGREISVPERSVPAYLRALRSVFLVRSLPGWSNNIATRAVATPKVSVADSGFACHLAGVDAAGLEVAASSALTGGLVEGFVAGELAKQQAWSAAPVNMFHYRDDHGRKVDIVLENSRREIVGVEVKVSSSPTARDFRGLAYVRDRLGDRFVAGVVLHTGTAALPFGDRLWALPLSTVWAH